MAIFTCGVRVLFHSPPNPGAGQTWLLVKEEREMDGWLDGEREGGMGGWRRGEEGEGREGLVR